MLNTNEATRAESVRAFSGRHPGVLSMARVMIFVAATFLLLPGIAAAQAQFLHLFSGAPDGKGPEGALLDINGVVYGATCLGGTYNRGTIFRVDGTGVSILYSFGSIPNDGYCPMGNPALASNGEIYGVTQLGGASGGGVVYSVTTSGVESIVYNFATPLGTTGSAMANGLIYYAGTLYGTTQSHTNSCGTVYEANLVGDEKTMHTFSCTDGDGPGQLFEQGGWLYGATQSGGTLGWGTIFRIGLAGGTFQSLYNFQGGQAGANPIGDLYVDAGGAIYGTTSAGGQNNNGVVFRLVGTAYLVLHAFTGGAYDGSVPQSGFAVLGNNFYGTTTSGGIYNFGTIYQVQTNGTETMLYSFFPTLGDYPLADLILDPTDTKLYGVATFGGIGGAGGNYTGDGSVFEIPVP